MKENYVDKAVQTINYNRLHDIDNIKIDTSQTRNERIKSYLEQVENPYCYLDHGVVVGISFTDTQVSLQERLMQCASMMHQEMDGNWS